MAVLWVGLTAFFGGIALTNARYSRKHTVIVVAGEILCVVGLAIALAGVVILIIDNY